MSTLKEIGNKLFKEDLASQKVELAGYDFKAYKSNFDSLFNSYRDNFRASINQAKKSVDTYSGNLFDLQRQMDAEYKSLVEKAKELGITVEGSPKQKEYNEMTAILNKAKANALQKGKDVSVLM